MGLPKGFIKNVSFINQNIGPEKRQDYLDEIDYKGMYLPKSVDYEDIDRTFIEFVDEDLVLNIDGEAVPVIFLTIQRWAEFSKTWEFSDKFKNFKMPFITIVRKPDVQVGTNQAGIWNIPGERVYTYIKIPTFSGGRKGVDTYKIPQPTSVDVTYEVRLFCNRMKDLNLFHKIIQTTFNSRQFYVKVNGHPMPIHLENIGDESQNSDFDKRRFYVQNFEMKVLGYILDEEDFQVIPMPNRFGLKFSELTGGSNKTNINFNIIDDDEFVNYLFKFEQNSAPNFSFISNFDVNILKLTNVDNITNIQIEVNDIVVMPYSLTLTQIINIKKGDKITITVVKNNAFVATFNLKGNKL